MAPPSVFVLGDSISIDYGPDLARALGWRADYARKAGEDLARRDLDVPAGANGGDSGMVLRYLEARADAGDLHPDLLVVNAGLHDIKRATADAPAQVPLDRYTANLLALVALCRRCGWRLAWVRTTPVIDHVHNSAKVSFLRFAADQAAWNAAADAVMSAAGVPSADLDGLTRALGGAELFRDHVHYHPETCRAQGLWLAGWICARL